MNKTRDLLMLVALAAVLGLGTACFRLLGIGDKSGDAEIAECAGLSGEAREDCEARHRQP